MPPFVGAPRTTDPDPEERVVTAPPVINPNMIELFAAAPEVTEPDQEATAVEQDTAPIATNRGNRTVTFVLPPPNQQGARPFVVIRRSSSPPPPSQRTPRQSRLSRWCNRCCRKMCLILTYPAMVVVSIIGLIVVLFFCVLPTILCMGIVICVYYCIHPQPLPLPVLLRNIFAGENISQTTTTFFHQPGYDPNNTEEIKAKRAQYRSELIVRKLLNVGTSDTKESPRTTRGEEKVAIIDHRSSNGGRNTRAPKVDPDLSFIDEACKRFIDNVNLRNHKFPIEIWTDHKSMYFSEPLEAPVEDGDDQESDKKAGLETESRTVPDGNAEAEDEAEDINGSGEDADASAYVPRYQRSVEIELSSTNRREATESTTTSNADSRLEDGGNSTDSNIDADPCPSRSDGDLADGDLADDGSADEYKNGSQGEVCKSDGGGDDDGTRNQHIDYFGIEDDSRDPGTTCDICILEFEVGDEVAWSPNMKCSHSFHKDCILDWLVRKPTCPSCRQNYVSCNADENV